MTTGTITILFPAGEPPPWQDLYLVGKDAAARMGGILVEPVTWKVQLEDTETTAYRTEVTREAP